MIVSISNVWFKYRIKLKFNQNYGIMICLVYWLRALVKLGLLRSPCRFFKNEGVGCKEDVVLSFSLLLFG